MKSQGGAPGAPPMKNNEEVLLGPYSQKTFWKGTNFKYAFKQLDPYLKNWSQIGQFLKTRVIDIGLSFVSCLHGIMVALNYKNIVLKLL